MSLRSARNVAFGFMILAAAVFFGAASVSADDPVDCYVCAGNPQECAEAGKGVQGWTICQVQFTVCNIWGHLCKDGVILE